MMTKITLILISILLMMLMKANNVMKTSFLILLTSIMMLFTLYMKSGVSWMPLIYLMIFTGGILMMFMMLSSILPNQKSLKMKLSKTILLLLYLSLIMNSYFIPQTPQSSPMKSFFSSNYNFLFMMILLTIYFFNSMNIVTQEEFSMRSFICWKKMNFVNLLIMNQL